MLLATRTMPRPNGDEHAPVLPLLDAVKSVLVTGVSSQTSQSPHDG